MSSTPSIRISQHQRFSPSPSASPMGIPGMRHYVPPPLPPPTYIPEISAGQDPGWQWGNDPDGAEFGRPASVKPGSSLLGGSTRDARLAKEHDYATQYPRAFARRASSVSTITLSRDHEMHDEPSTYSDEDGNSSRPNSNGLQSERQLEQRTLEQSSHSYDKQLLSRIGGPNTPKRQSLSYSAGNDAQFGLHERERRNSALLPLSVPERRHASVDSPFSAKWPSSGAVSPGNTSSWYEHGPPDPSRAPAAHRGSLASEEANTYRDNYDHSVFMHDDFAMEEGQMSNLNIHDRSPRSPKAGSKRRASSPPRDREDRSSVSSASCYSELHHRRSMQQLPARNSPVSRFHQSSLSSASSCGPRHGSLGSSLGISSVPSSATSYGSGRVSPGGMSPGGDLASRGGTSYCASQSLDPSPKMVHHQRTNSESTQGAKRKQSTDSATHSRSGSLSQVDGVHTCECCPKKPKKFASEDELRTHEAEKQYMCNYCPNRFKNKNEAERHQNSLHLRRHSWSCAILSGIEAAFHGASTPSADVCGYCGEEFPNPPQWDIRAEHLNSVHKFGECNQAKKFYRADHFRQHLKHSHQGTSGKWTNMLENACMKDEPPPEKRINTAIGMPPGAGQAPPTLMVTTTGLSGPPTGHSTIAETPHDT